jgi:hypothetical protein
MLNGDCVGVVPNLVMDRSDNKGFYEYEGLSVFVILSFIDERLERLLPAIK